MIPIKDENPTRHRPVATLALMVACVGIYFLWQPSPFSTTSSDVSFAVQLRRHPLRGGAPPPADDRRAPGHLRRGPGRRLRGGVPDQPGGAAPQGRSGWRCSCRCSCTAASPTWPATCSSSGSSATTSRTAWASPGTSSSTCWAAWWRRWPTSLTDPSATVAMIGASGAIAAVDGGVPGVVPRGPGAHLVMVFLVRIRAKWLLGFWFVLQFFTEPSSGVAWTAHVGGFAFGVLVGLLVRRQRDRAAGDAPRRPRRRRRGTPPAAPATRPSGDQLSHRGRQVCGDEVGRRARAGSVGGGRSRQDQDEAVAQAVGQQAVGVGPVSHHRPVGAEAGPHERGHGLEGLAGHDRRHAAGGGDGGQDRAATRDQARRGSGTSGRRWCRSAGRPGRTARRRDAQPLVVEVPVEPHHHRVGVAVAHRHRSRVRSRASTTPGPPHTRTRSPGSTKRRRGRRRGEHVAGGRDARVGPAWPPLAPTGSLELFVQNTTSSPGRRAGARRPRRHRGSGPRPTTPHRRGRVPSPSSPA